MPVQDRTGSKYERLLAASLIHLGYQLGSSTGPNYLHPGKGGDVIIPGTYIQPDLVVRCGETIEAVLYSTHWSNTRDSKRKFWRTWEEAAQQKAVLGHDLLTVNCVFEALPAGERPAVYVTSDELPVDPGRAENLPIAFRGWYPAVTYAMLESFDITVAFPVGYGAVNLVDEFVEGEHDPHTSELIRCALAQTAKPYYSGLTSTIARIREEAIRTLPILVDTHSRYKIGLLHLYVLYRLLQRVTGRATPTLPIVIKALAEADADEIRLEALSQTPEFRSTCIESLVDAFVALSKVYVRTGRNPKMLCLMREFSGPNANRSLHYVRLNDDLAACLEDLKDRMSAPGLVAVIERTFSGFDSAYGVTEALEDLADISAVERKEAFVRAQFADALTDAESLSGLLHAHAQQISTERAAVSDDSQNWVFEMLLYMAGLTSAEDIYTRITPVFERCGHSLRAHAPYGGDTMLIAHMLQGRDLCEHWSTRSTRRTMTPEQFRTCSWQAVATCICDAFADRGRVVRDSAAVIDRYLQNKSMRIIGSDLNPFYIMVEHYLGDLCNLKFSEDEDGNDVARGEFICPAWQTDVVNLIWGGRPLETWFEGVSRNGAWLVKVQSAQDGNEGHKTKELSGRSRGIHVAWQHGGNVRDRSQWSFRERNMRKTALVLDGDWDTTRKRNLYEAGWDWVGDVSQLNELRTLILQDR